MAQTQQIPVFLFTGFLDAGKTKFIQDTLENPEFTEKRRTLLLVCEEGEEEYDPTRFAGEVYTEIVENEDDLCPALLLSLVGKHRAHQVMVEYNGMWSLDTIYRSLAEPLAMAQEFAFFDASTILTYNANMRTQVVDKLQSCDLAIFNRIQKGADVMPFHKLVRGVSRTADIVYDHPDGTVDRDEIEDPLPFDKKAPVIVIADEDYALWYRDMGEHLDEYNGKTVKFRAQIARTAGLARAEMIAGRKIMTCCEADTTYSGLVVEYDGASLFREGEWIMLTARIALKNHKIYQNRGPVLAALDVARTDPPAVEVTTFA